MAGWKVFISKPSEFSRRSLRRYASGSKCPKGPFSYHNAEAVIDPQFVATKDDERGLLGPYRLDRRWPKQCDCGYEFQSGDAWQVNVHRLYDTPHDQLYVLRDLPPGAAWEAPWLAAAGSRWAGPDGKAWCIMFPGGVEWVVYGPSSSGKPWDVRGTMPNITVHPSIGLSGVYHGLLKKGIISEDADGRKFPGVPRTA